MIVMVMHSDFPLGLETQQVGEQVERSRELPSQREKDRKQGVGDEVEFEGG